MDLAIQAQKKLSKIRPKLQKPVINIDLSQVFYKSFPFLLKALPISPHFSPTQLLSALTLSKF